MRRNDSYESSSERRVNFGFGDASRVKQLAVHWPSGVEQQLHGLPTDVSFSLLEPYVTSDQHTLTTFSTPLGEILVMQAVLTNHSNATVHAYYAEQIRVGIDATEGLPATPLWTGDLRMAQLAPGASQTVFATHLLPTGFELPEQPLDHLWIVVDPGFGLDESRTTIAVP